MLSFLGYFFVPSSLGGLEIVWGVIFGPTLSIGGLQKNISISPKNRLVSKGLFHGFFG